MPKSLTELQIFLSKSGFGAVLKQNVDLSQKKVLYNNFFTLQTFYQKAPFVIISLK